MDTSPLRSPPTPGGSVASMDPAEGRKGQAARSRWFRISLLVGSLGIGALAVVLLHAGWADIYRTIPLPAPPTEMERYRAENRSLAMELALASKGQPYLVVDLSAPSLTLKSHGVPLRSFRVEAASVRSRRFIGLLGGERRVPSGMWEGGALLPQRKLERRVILSDTAVVPDKAGEVTFIPPAPEEENPTLPSFRIRFPPGLSTFILAADREGPGKEGLQNPEVSTEGLEKSEDADHQSVPKRSALEKLFLWIRVDPWQRDPVRLDLILYPPDAGALYRAFTDGTPLLMVVREP
jgi:hypothetical protein